MKHFTPLHTLIAAFSLFISVHLSAQPGPASNWAFGYGAGVSFNTGVPVSFPTATSIFTFEGCTSVSDAAGNFLFYTDGNTVWDRNNNPMPNGFGLLGNGSSTQSAVICPDPASPNKYYIFTADQGGYGGPNQGVYYNTVDMTLNSGNGDVVLKNQLLDAAPMTEKIVAVRHCDGTDFWIVVHKYGNSQFDAFLLTSAGINLTPVTSMIGTSEQELPPTDWCETIGYMKASPDGRKLAVGVYVQDNWSEVYDFNNQTGAISNPLFLQPNPTTSGYDGVYGISFSPDNSKFYVGWYGTTSYIYQYDLSSGNPATIIASLTTVATIPGVNIGALQIAPDNKIYVAPIGQAYLDVINNPNVAGVGCNFATNAVALTSGTCEAGLPNTVDAYVATSGNANLGPDQTVCGTSDTLTVSASGQVLWSTGDTTHTIVITSPGTYWVQVTGSVCAAVLSDTINITFFTPTPLNVGPDTTLCPPTGSYTISSNINTGPHLWSTGATTNSINVTTSGLYWLQVTDPCNNILSDSVNVTFVPPVNLGPDTTICGSGSYTLSANNAGPHLWSTGATTNSITVNTSGTYWVQVQSSPCTLSDTVNVTFATPQSVSLGPDTTLCPGSPNYTITPNVVNGSYLWSTGATTQTLTVSTSGTYWLHVTEPAPCNDVIGDTVVVTYVPAFSLPPDTSLCNGPLTINAPFNGTHLWSNGSTTNSINVTTSGTYWCQVSSGPCVQRDSMAVSIITPSAVNLGPDIVSCDTSAYIQTNLPTGPYLWNTGATTQGINVFLPGTYWVTVGSPTCSATDTINVDFVTGGLFHPINVFTPNSDAINDLFDLGNPPTNGFDVKIFDRWGAQLFESTDPSAMWDGKRNGKELPDGVYYWIATYEDCQGHPATATGFVHLIR